VVGGRAGLDGIQATAAEMGWAGNLTTMPNTHDPRTFYRQTRLLLMPSLWNESFGLVAAEGICNGIPVLGSTRGALPETIGEGGLLFDIPAKYTPESDSSPSPDEVEPWVEAVLRLWDDDSEYRWARETARRHAAKFQPESLASTYRDFFTGVFPTASPPLIPRE
jgi:glycosyltransferase involved in cell wall biosynthesis